MKNSPTPLSATTAHFPETRVFFLAVMIFSLMLFLPGNNPAIAQSDLAEIEFWQSVKTSKDPAELEAYLDLYPQGKFAPLARIRIKKLAPEQPVSKPADTIFYTPSPPPVELPKFKPANANVTDASCRLKLGKQGIAAVDFGGTGSICLCRSPYEISGDGASCTRPGGIEAPQEEKIDNAVAKPRPVKVKRKPKRVKVKKKTKPVKAKRRRAAPVKVKRKSVKRPPKARARAIANSYCRRRYGANLDSVVVKKSKFTCNYRFGDGNYRGVKTKKFKDVSG